MQVHSAQVYGRFQRFSHPLAPTSTSKTIINSHPLARSSTRTQLVHPHTLLTRPARSAGHRTQNKHSTDRYTNEDLGTQIERGFYRVRLDYRVSKKKPDTQTRLLVYLYAPVYDLDEVEGPQEAHGAGEQEEGVGHDRRVRQIHQTGYEVVDLQPRRLVQQGVAKHV